MGARSPLMRRRLDVPSGVELHLDWRAHHNGLPVAAPLPRVAELLGQPLDAVRQAAQEVEPYERADGVKVWSVLWVGVALGVRERPRRVGQGRQRPTRCTHGHDLTDPANVRIRGDGSRQCRPCARERERTRRSR